MSISNPTLEFPSHSLITPYNFNMIGLIARVFGGGPASATWGTANQARYIPLWVPDPVVVVKLAAYNGATAAGNTDVGIFSEAGGKLVSSGAVAQAGLNGWQEFDITDFGLNPGQYWVGLLNSDSTSTYFMWAVFQYGRAAGIRSEAVGAGALPTTATLGALDAGKVPMVGVALRTTF